MAKTIAFVSAKGGSGNTTLLINFAAALAQGGSKVCIIDACFDPYPYGVTFDIDDDEIIHPINHYLWGKFEIENTLIKLPMENGGAMSLILGSMKVGEQARILREGYDVGLLNDGIVHLAELFDYIVIDAGSSLSEESLMTMAVSDVLVINSDWKYLNKPAVFIEVATKLDVPGIFMVLNQVPKKVFDIPVYEFKNVFNLPMALIPNSLEIRNEKEIFIHAHPDPRTAG